MLESPLAALPGSDFEETHIGPYRILRLLGEGGMGRVYLAERADKAYEKQVAIKVLAQRMVAGALQRRFAYEKHILASLEHPNIARLFDAGTEKGWSYFVMEYVEGHPLTTYCDTRRLSIEDRLRLFQQVCRAVQYAQTHGVIHRDLKPSNILVTDAGEVKLLDFGIAKVVGEVQEGGMQTQTMQWLMTPAYAAPEQLKGRPVAMATDVYALGVVLYELLSGHRPYRLEGLEDVVALDGRIPTLERKAASEETVTVGESRITINPDTVSRARATTPAQLQRSLRGDLNTMVQKALQQDPTQRYDTVAAFAVDTDHYLSGRPIRAQKPTMRYRMGKFMKRHRVEVGIGAGALVLLVAGALFSYLQLRQERDTAQAEARKAQVMLQALTNVFEATNPFSANVEPADSLLTAHLLRRMQSTIQDLVHEPEAQLEIKYLMGTMLYETGRYSEADSMNRALLQQQKAVLGERHPDVAGTLDELGANLLWLGQYDEAEAYFTESLSIRRAHFPPNHPELSTSYHYFALLAAERGDLSAAEQWHRAALAGDQAWGNPDTLEQVLTMLELAGNLALQDKYEEAVLLVDEVDGIYKARGLDERPTYIQVLNIKSHIYEGHGRYQDAETALRQAIKLMQGWEIHPEFASLQCRLSEVLMQQRQYGEAEPLLKAALHTFETILGIESKDAQQVVEEMVELYVQWGKPKEADALRPLLVVEE